MSGTSITVNVQSGTTTVPCSTTSGATVSDLKTAIKNDGRFGADIAGDFDLVHGTRVMDASGHLSDYGVANGATVTIAAGSPPDNETINAKAALDVEIEQFQATGE
ncbi:ubiquitin-like domain-containing protein [Hamadaea tsunoensis]|uniref:ubiquitin-like domain-containing protein n=1 Tax=Hamadaea tsunoensis TaxID=53368 RepID=UPI00040FC5CA|nr:ubiquitin-like domain-containing protein [Hamadaea tsunoensis]